jgi:hypothetical protein
MDADTVLPYLHDNLVIALARSKQIGMNALWHESEKS